MRRVADGIFWGALLTAVLLGTALRQAPPERPETKPAKCWEDEECWQRAGRGANYTDDNGQWWSCWALDLPCED